jgi:hypothetical protein
LLQVAVDSNCKLITTSIETVEHRSDDGYFKTSSLYRLLERSKLNVSPDSKLPHTVLKVPFALLRDKE